MADSKALLFKPQTQWVVPRHLTFPEPSFSVGFRNASALHRPHAPLDFLLAFFFFYDVHHGVSHEV